MTRDHLFHKLVLHTIRTRAIIRDTIEDCDGDPFMCSREIACSKEAFDLLKEAEQYQPTIEQLKEWEKVKV